VAFVTSLRHVHQYTEAAAGPGRGLTGVCLRRPIRIALLILPLESCMSSCSP
jgi:hypothetical protein